MRTALLLALLLSGCDKPEAAPTSLASGTAAASESASAPGGVHTCNAITSNSKCMEMTGPGHTEADVKELCSDELTKGRYSREGCPTKDRIGGTCIEQKGERREFRTYYYAAGPMQLSADGVAKICHGEWVPNP